MLIIKLAQSQSIIKTMYKKTEKVNIKIEKDISSPNLGLSILKDRKAAIVGNFFYKNAKKNF